MDVRYDRFLDRLRGLSFVNRWNFHPTVKKENVGEHSFWVAIYASIFALMDNVHLVSPETFTQIVVSALYHDVEESVTGDLPMLVKREIDEWRRVEDDALSQLLKFLPHSMAIGIGGFKFPKSDEIHKYTKAADIFDVIMYCRSERQLGNTTFKLIEQEASTLLRRMKMTSVDTILDSYGYPKFEHSAIELPLDMTHL